MKPHMGAEFHCESFPGWSSERVLYESSWTFDVVVKEDSYESCTFLLGANDGYIPTYQTLENLMTLRRRALHHVPVVHILGYPSMENQSAFKRTFKTNFIAPFDAVFGDDMTHMTSDSAKQWAANLTSVVLRLDHAPPRAGPCNADGSTEGDIVDKEQNLPRGSTHAGNECIEPC